MLVATRPPAGATQFEIGQPDAANPRFRTLRAVHERYASSLATALSAFLRSEFQVSLEDLSMQTSGGFQAALPNPTCLMVFKLHPRDERMYLHMDCADRVRIAGTAAGRQVRTRAGWPRGT